MICLYDLLEHLKMFVFVVSESFMFFFFFFSFFSSNNFSVGCCQ